MIGEWIEDIIKAKKKVGYHLNEIQQQIFSEYNINIHLLTIKKILETDY